MKHRMIVAAMAAALAIPLTASSQPYGPGMMGGGYGPGYGMGPGMMGGGYGPGYGTGPGMMGGGYGPGYGMGPGMMGGGYGPGYGMGPGMMGPGMMGYGGGWGYGVDLSPEQRQKLSDIQREVFNKRWQLMEKMHAADGPMAQAWGGGEFDEKAARQAYDEMAQAHKEMFETQLDARKRMESVLTPEQREQFKRNYGGRWSRR